MGSGRIVSVIGAVIDVEFPREEVPEVYEALKQREDLGSLTQTYDEKADMWSVGVLLFVILAAYHPFDPQGDASDVAMQSAIRSGV